MLRIFNTFTAKKEILKPPRRGCLKLFVCGPTVYDYSHIGHARTYIVFDAIVKYLRSRGNKIFYLQNITDIDDKIISRAKQQKISWKKLSSKFEKEYFKDMKAIGITSVTKYAKATDHIKEVINQVKKLLKKGFAYEISDGIYYDISKFKDYGKLSGRTILQAEDAVSRIDDTKEKRNKGDFCLWKFSMRKPEQSSMRKGTYEYEPKWKSPFGLGRPGWHIEDTAITEKFFGPQYDLHGGAIDLKFPHHESEIAQQEAASGKKPFVKIWLHTGFLLVNGEKMSKSLGNFIFIKDFLKKYPAEVLRFIVFSHHYRSPIDYNKNLAINAQNSIRTIEEFLEKLEFIQKSKIRIYSGHSDVIRIIRVADKMFNQAMDDDFNTPKALAVIFDLIAPLQDKIWQINSVQAKTLNRFINEKLSLFGIRLKPVKIPQKIRALAKQREKLRTNKQFIPADRLRKKIETLGYRIEDTTSGPLVLKKS